MRTSLIRNHAIGWRLLVAVMLVLGLGPSSAWAYEVWVTDQSDTAKESGGYLYIYDGAQLAAGPSAAKPAVTMDLAGDVNKFCEEATKKPVRRPHMLFFTKDQSHAILSFLSGHVLFMDAATRKPVACVATGKNVHAAWPTPDQKMAIAANIAEKKFIRIWTDYKDHKFSYDAAKDVLDLGPMEKPELPDMAPICPITDNSGKYAIVTLRGGGLLVVNVTETPMKVVASLENGEIHPAGCGGVQVGNNIYINSGGGWPVAPLSYDIYSLDISNLPHTVTAKLITTRDGKKADSHGMVAVGHNLWNADRAGNNIEIINTTNNASEGSIELAGKISDDPAPDLLDVSPDGDYVFAAFRGPTPLTGNDKGVNNAVGSTPGVGVIKVIGKGRMGELTGVARITNIKDGKETADPHGIAVRK